LIAERLPLGTFLNLNQASSRTGNSLERFCASAGSIAVRFRTLAHNQPQAQLEGGFARIAPSILPSLDGGLLPRTLFNSVATLYERRTNPAVIDRHYKRKEET